MPSAAFRGYGVDVNVIIRDLGVDLPNIGVYWHIIGGDVDLCVQDHEVDLHLLGVDLPIIGGDVHMA